MYTHLTVTLPIFSCLIVIAGVCVAICLIVKKKGFTDVTSGEADSSMYEQSKSDGIYQTVNRQTTEPIYYPAPGMGERSSSGDMLSRSAGTATGGTMFTSGYDVPQTHRTYEMPYLNKRCLPSKNDNGVMQTCLQSGQIVGATGTLSKCAMIQSGSATLGRQKMTAHHNGPQGASPTHWRQASIGNKNVNMNMAMCSTNPNSNNHPGANQGGTPGVPNPGVGVPVGSTTIIHSHQINHPHSTTQMQPHHHQLRDGFMVATSSQQNCDQNSESDEEVEDIKMRASEFKVATLKRGSLGMWKASEGFDT